MKGKVHLHDEQFGVHFLHHPPRKDRCLYCTRMAYPAGDPPSRKVK